MSAFFSRSPSKSGPADVSMYNFRPRTNVPKTPCYSVMSMLAGFLVKLPGLHSLLVVWSNANC